MKFFLFIVLIIAIAFGAVAFQNSTEISVKFFHWDFTGHIAIILGVPFIIGVVAGISLVIPSLWKKAANARNLRKKIHELEEEMAGSSEPAEQIAHEGEAEQETEDPRFEKVPDDRLKS